MQNHFLQKQMSLCLSMQIVWLLSVQVLKYVSEISDSTPIQLRWIELRLCWSHKRSESPLIIIILNFIYILQQSYKLLYNAVFPCQLLERGERQPLQLSMIDWDNCQSSKLKLKLYFNHKFQVFCPCCASRLCFRHIWGTWGHAH